MVCVQRAGGDSGVAEVAALGSGGCEQQVGAGQTYVGVRGGDRCVSERRARGVSGEANEGRRQEGPATKPYRRKAG